jgi:FkbM family methyltransferase
VTAERRIRLVNAILSVPPFRFKPVRRALLRGRRALVRARRGRLERRGDERLSRPALHDLDAALQRHLPERGGVFVEAGAFDGYEQSNTYFLERFRDWTGVLVEPVPELYREATRNRPGAQVFNCALGTEEQAGDELTMRYGGLMSIVAGAQGDDAHDSEHVEQAFAYRLEDPYDFTVTARTLTSVLEEAGIDHVDLLSLDVEGYEANVLRGLDLDRFGPRYLLIEMLDRDRRRPEIEAVLGERYEWVEAPSPNDGLYRRAS